MAKKPQKLDVGKDAVVIGNVEGFVADGSTVIGATDVNGNTILNQPMAIGRDAHAGPGAIAVGAGAGHAGAFAGPLIDSEMVFNEIAVIVSESNLSPEFKRIIRRDLDDAKASYSGEAYKSCVVMLGAALEGFMLGTLQRPDVIKYFQATPTVPAPIQRLGTLAPDFSDKIGNNLGFEDYKVALNELIAGLKDLGVDNIQSFRNAIHPWKAIKNPELFGVFDQARALHYLGSYKVIIETIGRWMP